VGFDRIGFASARLSGAAQRLETWLARGHHGEMQWMAREPARRVDAGRVFAGSKTVVCCALSYYQGGPSSPRAGAGIIASFARGADYHHELEQRLDALSRYIETRYAVPTRRYVDTGPLLEKAYASAAGLGWIGKHSNLVSRRGSSWFFLGEILLPLELPPDPPETDHCGSCQRCLASCPTGAIIQPYVIDSRLCISYLTIELRGAIPFGLRHLVGQRIFGCDVCQEVCPWNRFAATSREPALAPREPLCSMDLIAMLRMSREEFSAATKGSAVRRARYGGFLRNVAVALGNSGDRRAVAALAEGLQHPEVQVRAHSAWALGRLGGQEAGAVLRSALPVEKVGEVHDEIRLALQM
jgi:epoxyqueuosine reductase